MILPSVIKNYWQSVANRIQGITLVMSVTHLDELTKIIKSLAYGDVILVVVLPSYDGSGDDADNVKDNAQELLLILKVIDRKEDTETDILAAYDSTTEYVKSIRKVIDTDKRVCNTYVRYLNHNNVHIDPEQFDNCVGHSISFSNQDTDVMQSTQFAVGPDIYIYHQGLQGNSAYQVWINAGNTGTVQDYLDSLKGADAVPDIKRHHWQAPYSYNGRAPIGSNEDDAVWIVERLTISASGSVTATDMLTDVKWIDILTLNF